MQGFNTIDDILNFAIEEEEKSYEFYTDLADRIPKRELKLMLIRFAGQENEHKAKLLTIRHDKSFMPTVVHIQQLSDNVRRFRSRSIAVEDMDYAQVLHLAVDREQESAELYTNLVGMTEDSTLQATFRALAQEEEYHKHEYSQRLTAILVLLDLVDQGLLPEEFARPGLIISPDRDERSRTSEDPSSDGGQVSE